MKKNLHLLIIDDDADDVELFREAVAEVDQSIKCTIAKDGQVGLEILRNNPKTLPDLIFLDLRMPRFSGKKFLVAVKEEKTFKDIPVIIYTTSREVGESIDLKKLGAVHFISKPNDPEEIYYLVAVLLEEFQTREHSMADRLSK